MSGRSTVIVCLILIASIGLSVSAPIAKRAAAQVITYEQFLAIEFGWTSSQISQYLNNNPGEVQSQTTIGTITIVIIQYANTDPIGIAMFVLTNDQLTAKSQSEVCQNVYPINRAQFDQITTGMTKAQVAAVVGNEGELVAQTMDLVEIRSYQGDQYAIAQITFYQGAVITKVETGL